VLGGHDEVALVLSVLVVDDDDDLPGGDGAVASSMVAMGTVRTSPVPAKAR
jgi:hypothetical protein